VQFVCPLWLNGASRANIGQTVAGGLKAARRRARKRRFGGNEPRGGRRKAEAGRGTPEDPKPQGGRSDGSSSVAKAERLETAE
jgi:hypothetical protein